MMNELIYAVEQWADKKNLLRPENAIPQTVKVMEELGETARALLKKDRKALVDGIGDTVVTLIILARQNGMTLQECLEAAYDEIKDREGVTGADGIFRKNEALEEAMIAGEEDPNAAVPVELTWWNSLNLSERSSIYANYFNITMPLHIPNNYIKAMFNQTKGQESNLF